VLDRRIGALIAGEYRLERAFQVGEGGMMLSSSRPLHTGDRLVVTFTLTKTVMIVVRGIVRSLIPEQNGLPPRYGIEFENLGFQFKREIRNYVAAATHAEGRTAVPA
jgi:hypothetical protein